MRRLTLLLTICLFILPYFTQAQIEEKGYQFVLSVDNGMQRKMYANEILLDDTQQFLVVNYGNKPTYITVFKYGSWEPLFNYRLPDWVDFSGAYFDYETLDFYIKASRYSTEYYRLDLENGEQEIRECETLPGGCPVIEPKQSPKSMFSKDKEYYVTINKKNARDVRVYRKR